jgi:hypothetical protein
VFAGHRPTLDGLVSVDEQVVNDQPHVRKGGKGGLGRLPELLQVARVEPGRRVTKVAGGKDLVEYGPVLRVVELDLATNELLVLATLQFGQKYGTSVIQRH